MRNKFRNIQGLENVPIRMPTEIPGVEWLAKMVRTRVRMVRDNREA